jgi:hypothetical protein
MIISCRKASFFSAAVEWESPRSNPELKPFLVSSSSRGGVIANGLASYAEHLLGAVCEHPSSESAPLMGAAASAGFNVSPLPHASRG